MARKLAAFCEFFGVRTAWHGPGDVSPVGHAANLHLDLSSPNFGIQEVVRFGRHAEVFPGTPEIRDGCCGPTTSPVSASTSMKRWPPNSHRPRIPSAAAWWRSANPMEP